MRIVEPIFLTGTMVLISIIVVGCAATNFRPKIQLNDPLADTYDLEAKADHMSWGDASDVVVISSNLPKGVTIQDGKAMITADFDYEIIGQVYTQSKGDISTHGEPVFYFYDYPEDEAWRKYYCYPQVPLTWLTLSLWAYVVPTYYPCATFDTNSAADVRDRKARLVNALKKAAKAMGATHMLFLGQKPLEFESTQGSVYHPKGSAFSFGSSTTVKTEMEWGRAWGLALKKK